MENLPDNILEAKRLLRVIMRHRPYDIFNYDVGDLIAIVDETMDEPDLERFVGDAVVMGTGIPALYDVLNSREINIMINNNADIIPVVIHHIDNEINNFTSPHFRRGLIDIRDRLNSLRAARIHHLEYNFY